VEVRERQMEEASAKKVAAVAAERDGAQESVRCSPWWGWP
jgi:predicted transcriptional regulator